MEWSTFKLNEQGLLPVVVQSAENSQVLMVAYMDQLAYEETQSTGEMVYYSRSRQERWKKGETSGHIQKVVSLMADCDKDTLLAKVEQVGVACHTGQYSCFEERIVSGNQVIKKLETIIESRKEANDDKSYTAYLFDKGVDKILKKVGEETAEVIIAAKNSDKEELIYETSDLMYHLLVLLNQQGVAWNEIEASLKERFPAK